MGFSIKYKAKEERESLGPETESGATDSHQISCFRRSEYAPFGQVVSQTGSFAGQNNILFSTKYWDKETGLGCWPYRWHNGERWMSRDAMGERASSDLYAMTQNSPVDNIDALGLISLTDRELKRNCLDKEKWFNTGAVYGGSPGTNPIYRNWNCLVDQLAGKMKVDVTCRECCWGDQDPGRTWYDGTAEACRIKICANKIRGDRSEYGMLMLFVHELTHCWQIKRKGYKKQSCEECMQNEVEAYAAAQPDMPPNHWTISAMNSCLRNGACASKDEAWKIIGDVSVDPDAARKFGERWKFNCISSVIKGAAQ